MTWKTAVSAYEALIVDLDQGWRWYEAQRQYAPRVTKCFDDYMAVADSAAVLPGIFTAGLTAREKEGFTSLFHGNLYRVLYGGASAEGSVWSVTPEMCQVLTQAAATFPGETLELEDLPEPGAFVWFETPISLSERHVVQSALWFRVEDSVCIQTFPPSKTGFPVVGNMTQLFEQWPFGAELGTTKDHGKREGVTAEHLLKALWALSAQRITEPTEETMDRSARRRLQQKRMTPPAVKLIQLRRRYSANGNSPGPPVEWSHRWTVDGHWRNQYLPSQKRHRQTYIASYVKGPEDKPLVLKRRVVNVSA